MEHKGSAQSQPEYHLVLEFWGWGVMADQKALEQVCFSPESFSWKKGKDNLKVCLYRILLRVVCVTNDYVLSVPHFG